MNSSMILRNMVQNITRNHYATLLSRICVARLSTPSALKQFEMKWKRLLCRKYSTQFSPLQSADEALKDEQYRKNQREKMNRTMKYSLLFLMLSFTGSGVYLIFSWGKPGLDEDGNPIEDCFSSMPIWEQYIKRSYQTLKDYNEVLKEPSRELLLPPPLQHPYLQPPFTLVLELTGVLLHPEWTYKTGWRFKKRPFLEYFLQQCGPPLFEVVIFTEESGFTAFPLIDNFDQNGYIMHRLFRDSTRYESGTRLKDLNCLNRDLSKVIHVDWNKSACKLNRKNCLILDKWDGNNEDRTLFELAQFLRAVSGTGESDVREVLEYYSQFEHPLEVFKENQAKAAQEQEQNKSANKSSLVNSFKRKY